MATETAQSAPGRRAASTESRALLLSVYASLLVGAVGIGCGLGANSRVLPASLVE